MAGTKTSTRILGTKPAFIFIPLGFKIFNTKRFKTNQARIKCTNIVILATFVSSKNVIVTISEIV